MTAAAVPPGWRLRRYEVLGSTSDLCRTLAEAGEPDGLAVLAGRQTQGRGRSGRGWESPPGNLSLSALLRPGESARAAAQWALLAGVAVAESLACPRIRLKWPNDLLLDDRKLGGVLVESATGPDGGIRWLVIGMGVNLAAAPDVPGRAIACLAEIAPPPAPEDVAASVLARLSHWRRRRTLDGFAPVRAAWLSHAQPVGAPMTIKLADREVGGAFEGLAEDGGLMLRTGGRVHAFAAGEVVLPSQRAA